MLSRQVSKLEKDAELVIHEPGISEEPFIREPGTKVAYLSPVFEAPLHYVFIVQIISFLIPYSLIGFIAKFPE